MTRRPLFLITALFLATACDSPVEPPAEYELTLTLAGSGSGSVTSAPAGIDCGTDCSETLTEGASVVLTATPDEGSTFEGWSGGGCAGAATCTVSVDGATSVTATFAVAEYALAVARSGNGAGAVTSAPSGIDCGVACVVDFEHGAVITLTAEAAPGSVFMGWSGAGCAGTGVCEVTLTEAETVVAAFDATSFATSGSWECELGETCQDVYDLTLPANSVVSIAVTGLSGGSVARLGVFAPGSALSGVNLLTGLAMDRECQGQDVSDAVQFRTGAAGSYRIAAARDWGSSNGFDGAYTLVVSAESGVEVEGQTVDDEPSGAVGSQCGYTYTVDGSWNCELGESCQDVFDFETFVGTRVTVEVSNLTGASVPRLAVFEGADLSTTNRLNGLTSDRECVGQDTDDSDESSSLSLGLHRWAVGRDWGSSAGTDGTYTATLTTEDAPLIILGQTSDDTPSLLATTSCP